MMIAPLLANVAVGLAWAFGALVLFVFLIVMAVRWEQRHSDERESGEGLIDFFLNFWH